MFYVRRGMVGVHILTSENDEISTGVSWRLTRAASYPLDPPAVAQPLGPGNWLINNAVAQPPTKTNSPRIGFNNQKRRRLTTEFDGAR
jgi:hypothetical protein